jgi:hypothetical protein
MGWREDLMNVGLNMLTFGGYGMGQAIGQAMQPAASQVESQLPNQLRSFWAGPWPSGGIYTSSPIPHSPVHQCPPGAVASPPPAMIGSAREACCERFRLNDGYLVDGVTGSVWRLNTRENVLEEVPRRPTKVTADLWKPFLEAQLDQVKQSYSSEVLNELPAAQRARQLRAFENRYLKPLRAALTATRRGN